MRNVMEVAMTAGNVRPALSEHIVEIRFRSNARVIDNRGVWSEEIAEAMALEQWKVVPDRIDVGSADWSESCFVTVANAGYSVRNQSSAQYFYERANKFLKWLFSRPEFRMPLEVTRIGVRSRFCFQFAGDFTALLALFTERYVAINPVALETMDAQLVDAGAPLNFSDSYGRFNTSCGPMQKPQVQQFFPNAKDSDVPETGLYLDIDYFKQPRSALSEREIISDVRLLAEQGWQRSQKVAYLILGVPR